MAIPLCNGKKRKEIVSKNEQSTVKETKSIERQQCMEALDSLGALYPLMFGFITLVIILAKMHSDIDVIKEKLKVLFDLWNNRNN